jgi:hypothetical protein
VPYRYIDRDEMREYDGILRCSQKRLQDLVSPAFERLAKLTPPTLQNSLQPFPPIFWSNTSGLDLPDPRVDRRDRLPATLQRRSSFACSAQRAAQKRYWTLVGELFRSRFSLGTAKLA